MSINNMQQETGGPSYTGIILIFEIAVLVSSFYYIQLLVDTVAKYLGYQVSMFVLPAIISGLLAFLIGRQLCFEAKKNTMFVILTTVVSVAPVSIFLLLVNFSSGPL